MEVDCSYVFLFSEDKTTLHNTHEWCAAGIEPQIQRMQDVPFVKANQERLAQMPVAYFVVCATLREDTEDPRREVAAYLDPLREIIEPVEERFFAGAIDRSKLSFPLRLVLKAMKAEEGDWRDWDAIRAWAADLYPAL